jgi:ribosomal protein L32E
LANAREELEKLVQQLERQRDELQVKMSLAKLEARQQWEKLENQWKHLKTNSSQMREEVSTTAENVGATLRKTAEEIRDGYARLRKLL